MQKLGDALPRSAYTAYEGELMESGGEKGRKKESMLNKTCSSEPMESPERCQAEFIVRSK